MNLAELQKRMGAAIMRPLTPSENIARRSPDGRPMRDEAAEFIKPNDRLTSLERLEIYNRQYWYRVLDSFYEDFPGLRSMLGQRPFNRLAEAYIAECPSRSFTLRDLGSSLEEWLRRNPRFAGRRFDLAMDMARLEWAHIVAFDGAADPVLGPEDLLELGPEFRAGLQPYITLLDLKYPVDNLRVRVNAQLEDHGTASNALAEHKERGPLKETPRPKRQRVFCAVHRWDYMVYYRRLTPEEFRLLDVLRQGKTMGEAVEAGFGESPLPLDAIRQQIEGCFKAWAELGWFCRSQTGKRS
jgi:hypothetical protein